ncbi:MAG: polyprenyl synthetase family protein, partial [Candidatus Omnitrophica bacterium]|nr:polyprenyl synthetase family protein [Candidatus Omnitrophota bacterium]
NTLSVLAGDYLYSQAFCLLSAVGSPEVLRLMSRTSQRVCVGEVTQVRHQGDLELGEATYLAIIQEKTASLMAAACQGGAQLAGADPAAAQALADFGQAFGTAFQIVDDTQDVLGEEARLGKSLGTDLEHGQMTLPLITLRERADAATRRQVLDLLRRHGNGSTQQLRELALAHDVASPCFDKARRLADDAKAALRPLPASAARQGLLELTDYILSA